MTHRSADTYRARLSVALDLFEAMRPRSMQRSIGISSVGHCHSEALFRLRGADPTDAPAARKALHGTALHTLYSEAMYAYDPSLIVEPELTVTLPSGLVLTGHPDWIDPAEPSVTDLKTKDDEAAVYAQRRAGSSEQQNYQRHLYGLAAIQAGIVPAEGLIVRNVWVDRAGQSAEPLVEQEPFDMAVVHAADSWLQDLVYADEHNEDVPKDKHYDWCAKFCPFFSACRTDERAELTVTDPEMTAAMRLLFEGRAESKAGGLLESAAKATLAPLQQSADGNVGAFLGIEADGTQWRLRWIWVNQAERAGYWKAMVEKG